MHISVQVVAHTTTSAALYDTNNKDILGWRISVTSNSDTIVHSTHFTFASLTLRNMYFEY